MPTLSEIYTESLAAWSRGDREGMARHFAPHIEWVPNPSMTPVIGKAAMLAFMEKFGRGMTDIHYTHKLAIESGNTLFVEGVENYTKHGKRVSVPYAGVVEFEHGLIIRWRDYFDLKALESQLAGLA